jgi:uncharacterized protein YbjT (DUF2867 family)
MKVFVTGAGGYIGGAVARRLRRAGHHVIGLVRTKEASQQLKELSIEPVRGSLEDVQVLHRASKEADAVVNAADADHAGAIDTLIEQGSYAAVHGSARDGLVSAHKKLV